MFLSGLTLPLIVAGAVLARPAPPGSCFATALAEIREARTRADSLALAEKYLAAPPGGDTRCAEGLAGFLLGMKSSPAPDAWQERQRAGELIERALRDYRDEPRLYLALALVLHHRQSRTDALRNLDRATDRAGRGEVPLSARELAIIQYTRGTIQQDFWRDWRTYGQIDQVSVGQWRCSRDQAPTADNFSSSSTDFTWLVPVNQLCPEVFARNMAQYFRPRSDMNRDAQADMESAFRSAWEADPTFLAAPVALLGEMAYAGEWTRADSLTRGLLERYPDDARVRLFRVLVLHELGQDSLAHLTYTAARADLSDSLARPFDDIRPLLRVDQQQAYDALDTLGQREVRVAFWTSIEPLFLTTWNERRMEHAARVVAANLLFSSTTLGMDGWESFSGQVWIRYGRPQHRWELQAPGGRVVFWDYGAGPDISFLRGFGYRSFRPTDPAIEVGNVLARTSPQTYAMSALVDTVLPLEVQVVRTLGPSNRPQVLVYGEWPAAVSDAARAGLTLLDLSYFPVAQWRGGKPTLPGIGAELNGMASGTYSLTVEVWDTAQRRLHRLRDTLTTLPTEGAFLVSDLLLVTGIRPPPDDITSRRELPVTPLYGAEVPRGTPLGIVWETYQVSDSLPGDGRRRYQVSVEVLSQTRGPMLARILRSVTGGERRGTRIEYESSRPMAGGRTVEWVEVSSDLPIGGYRLAFTITDRETGAAVTREREFRIR
jgi:GWxTD domain-containing protein